MLTTDAVFASSAIYYVRKSIRMHRKEAADRVGYAPKPLILHEALTLLSLLVFSTAAGKWLFNGSAPRTALSYEAEQRARWHSAPPADTEALRDFWNRG